MKPIDFLSFLEFFRKREHHNPRVLHLLSSPSGQLHLDGQRAQFFANGKAVLIYRKPIFCQGKKNFSLSVHAGLKGDEHLLIHINLLDRSGRKKIFFDEIVPFANGGCICSGKFIALARGIQNEGCYSIHRCSPPAISFKPSFGAGQKYLVQLEPAGDRPLPLHRSELVGRNRA